MQTRGRAAVALQMRVAKPVVVVEDNSPKAITTVDKQFDARAILLCVADRTLEAIAIKSSSVDSDDLSTDGHLLLERRPIPQHADEPTVRPQHHAKGISQVCYLAAGVGRPVIIEWRVRVENS